MTFETFKKILDLQVEHYRKSNELYKLGIDTIELTEPLSEAVDLLWKNILTKEGEDHLSWFVFEKDYISGKLKEDMKTWDEEGNEIINNLEELYSYLVDNCYFRAKKD